MCGIWGYIEIKSTHDLCKLFMSFMELQKRGPDRSDFKIINEFMKIYLGFHRLAIMDRSTYGDQPFTLEVRNKDEHKSIYAICNGEIYNFKKLVEENGFTLRSRSDCEFIPQMYAKYGFKKMMELLVGEFAICVIDINHLNDDIQVYVGRDQTAVRPVFVGQDVNGIGFSSTLAGLVQIVNPKKIRQLGRAQFMHINIVKNEKIKTTICTYHHIGFGKSMIEPVTRNAFNNLLATIRNRFIEAVNCRMESDRPIGALLSGGLDSSLVCSIASDYLKRHNKQLRTFSIGIAGSTDKEYALMVANHCGTVHQHIEFTQQQFLDALEDVVRVTETYDITSVRASTGQYLISKWIRENTDIKVLLIGDGSDELCAGYMYFHNAPDSHQLHLENIRLLEDICYYDVLRADRCIAGNGLEARVPFLDHRFVDLYLSIDPRLRTPRQRDSEVGGRNVEKWLLRKAFDTVHQNHNDMTVSWLPEAVLWRKKEAFSDGVSSQERSWYQIIQEDVETMYTDDDFKDPNVSYHLQPPTKEALHFRNIFNRHFHPEAAGVIPYYWMPKWSGSTTDPSARVLSVYNQDK
jgi:asparagine synthase (glutamine-hydrolysing)